MMTITIHHPKRTTTIKGPMQVSLLLQELGLVPETVLVIRNQDLVTEDEMLKDEDKIEIRPVISGG